MKVLHAVNTDSYFLLMVHEHSFVLVSYCYIALISALKQTHCALVACVSNDDVWLNVLTCLTRFLWRILNVHRSGVLKHCLVFTWHKPLPIAVMTVFFV